MLWRIRDFKGIRTADLDIRQGKTTILTGVNSSGKSSIIQSLLLIAQSLQSDNQVILNGPLVRLGDAQDLVREGASGGAIGLALGLEAETPDEGLEGEDLLASFDLIPASDRSSLRTRRLEIRVPGNDDLPFKIGRDNSRKSDVEQVLAATASMGPREVLHVKSLLHSERRQLRTYVVIKGLRPVAVVQLMKPDEVEDRYRNLLDALLHRREAGPSKSAPAASARIGGYGFIREFVRLALQATDEDDDRLVEFAQARQGNPFYFDSAWAELNQQERKNLIGGAALARAKLPYVLVPLRRVTRAYGLNAGLLESHLIDLLGSSYDALNALSVTLDSVADSVQYLGPLRDEPRVVWNHWNELARGLPVGTRGEYSAAVLSRSNSMQVHYTTPSSKTLTAPLSDAVNEWLTYLEIGDTVSARSHGKLGVGFDLRVNGQVRDLTSVGVGVSQALPLLVGLLTSPPGSIFIVEQPELHLHPGVQARLADFMLNARPDVALIVETHSESFITRIRRRAAEGSFKAENVDITFVEPALNGSTARILEVSEFGDLSEWPEGFLSSAEEDVRAILSANIKRSMGGSVGS